MESEIAYNIKGIQIINSVLKATLTPFNSKSVFRFDVNFKTEVNFKEGRFTVLADAIIKNNESSELVGQYTAAFHYSVDDLDKHVKNKGEAEWEMPTELLKTLLGISVSTIRGMMYEAYKGTFLGNAVLPLVDIANIQPELSPLAT